MFYDDWKIGDTVIFSIIENGKMTGVSSQKYILDETLFGYIKKYEDETNRHNWRKI